MSADATFKSQEKVMGKFDVEEVDDGEIEVVRSESGDFDCFAEAKAHALGLYEDRLQIVEDQIDELMDDVTELEDVREELDCNRSKLKALAENDVRDNDEA